MKNKDNDKTELSATMEDYFKKPSRKKLDKIGKQLESMSEQDVILSLLSAAQNCGEDVNPDIIDSLNSGNGNEETKIAENCVRLAEFVIERQKIEHVAGLKAEVRDNTFVVYALTPDPVELDFPKYATSEVPQAKELLMEKEALEADLFLKQDSQAHSTRVIRRIESGLL